MTVVTECGAFWSDGGRSITGLTTAFSSAALHWVLLVGDVTGLTTSFSSVELDWVLLVGDVTVAVADVAAGFDFAALRLNDLAVPDRGASCT